MDSINIIAGIGIFFIVVLLVILFLLPTEGARRRKKKRKRPTKEEQEKQKDWERIAGRLEGQGAALRQEVARFQKKVEDLEKEVMGEKAKTKKLQEKLSQERGWKEKEKGSVEKKVKEAKKIKEELIQLQELFGKEHAQNLRMNSEKKEMKHARENLMEEKKRLESEYRKSEIKGEEYRNQIAHLKKDVAKLSKKEADTQWVTKTEYDRVRRLLKEKEKELERVARGKES